MHKGNCMNISLGNNICFLFAFNEYPWLWSMTFSLAEIVYFFTLRWWLQWCRQKKELRLSHGGGSSGGDVGIQVEKWKTWANKSIHRKMKKCSKNQQTNLKNKSGEAYTWKRDRSNCNNIATCINAFFIRKRFIKKSYKSCTTKVSSYFGNVHIHWKYKRRVLNLVISLHYKIQGQVCMQWLS